MAINDADDIARRDENMQGKDTYIFDGCDMADMAEKYGTPLYVVSETGIRERCAEIRQDFLEKYPGTKAVYASKALQTLDICRLIREEGLGLDVVSGGELYTALKAGTDPAKIVFHGNNKSEDECKMALMNHVGTIVADNFSELMLLSRIAAKSKQKARVMLRYLPAVDSHTHKYISTGHADSKFGFSKKALLEDGLLKKTLEMQNLEIIGLHFHIGSQLLENDSHLLAVDSLLSLLSDIYKSLGFVPKELNLGGGFGIQYAGDPKRRPVSYFVDPMMERITGYFAKNGFTMPVVTIEPGRFIVGESGITLYRIGSVKTTDGGRTYAAVDGGFPDNPRTALYQAKYDAVAVEKIDAPKDSVITIAGKCCESGDILIWDAVLPELERGDLLAVLCTGAYNYSMASNYNRTPRPALIMVRDGLDRLSVKRETYEDLVARES